MEYTLAKDLQTLLESLRDLGGDIHAEGVGHSKLHQVMMEKKDFTEEKFSRALNYAKDKEWVVIASLGTINPRDTDTLRVRLTAKGVDRLSKGFGLK
jgi:hypothetical protein